mmetsp:Transcript_76623/g.192813  ORF Transcript_76623/g.192813 Transcript_76623/m.192813 type:complete len:200 (+) Transcript_76623:133-732(+)
MRLAGPPPPGGYYSRSPKLCRHLAHDVLPMMVPSLQDPIWRVDDVLVPDPAARARVEDDGVVAPAVQLAYVHAAVARRAHTLQPPELHFSTDDEAGVRVRSDGLPSRGLGRVGEVDGAAAPPLPPWPEALTKDDTANVGAGLVVHDPGERLCWPRWCAGSTAYPCQVPLLLLHLTVASPHPDLATVDARVPLLCAKAEA